MDIRNPTPLRAAMSAVEPRETDTPLVDGDYALSEGAAWFTVGPFSVRIRLVSSDEVACAVYRLNNENDESLASMRTKL